MAGLCEMGLAICRGRGSALSARWQGLCQLLSQGCDARQIAIRAITLFVTEEEVGVDRENRLRGELGELDK